MNTTQSLIVLGSILLFSTGIIALIALNAPRGHQDENGFHFDGDDLPDGWC